MKKELYKQMSNKEEKKEKKKNKKRKKHTFLKVFLFLILLVILFFAGFIGYSTFKNGWGVKGIIQTAMGQDEKKLKNLKPFNVLILGVSKDISVELTDTIIVASYNPKTQKATLLSIPRDTFVGSSKTKATSYDKINALYQKNPEKTLEAVNKITGLGIEYYVVISNNALVQLVDAIGGVEYDVPINMDYDDSSQDLYIHLDKGYQKLSGEQAEWLVRFRHNNNGTSYPSSYGDNDLGRMRTQREFLKVVGKQVLQLKNLTKIGSFIDIFKENVTTNIKDWSLIKDYIPYAIDFDMENLQTAVLPGTPGSLGPYNLSFFIHNEKQTKELIDELFTNQNVGEEDQDDINETNVITEKNTVTIDNNKENTTNTTNSTKTSNTVNNSKFKIELLNGTGDSTLLTKATNQLKNAGYNVHRTGTTTITSKTTIVNKKAIESKAIESIKNTLGVGNISNSISSNSTADVTIVIGKDYK